MYTIYVIDRANQLLAYAYPTKDDAYEASDRFEAAGCDVFTDRTQAVLNKDSYDRFLRRQSKPAPRSITA